MASPPTDLYSPVGHSHICLLISQSNGLLVLLLPDGTEPKKVLFRNVPGEAEEIEHLLLLPSTLVPSPVPGWIKALDGLLWA